jgi:Uma2 family endonuclease
LKMSTDTEIISRKLFSVEEFQRISDAGIFPPDSRFELIRGEIIEMPNPTRLHSGRVNKLNRVFTFRLGESAIVCIQNPMFIDKMSEPRPDVVICKPLPELFGPFEPEPADVLLLVEISDTSLRYDTKIKSRLYAEAGIPEYWILNIPDEVFQVRTDPSDGEYRRIENLKRGQPITASMLPGIVFTTDELLV